MRPLPGRVRHGPKLDLRRKNLGTGQEGCLLPVPLLFAEISSGIIFGGEENAMVVQKDGDVVAFVRLVSTKGQGHERAIGIHWLSGLQKEDQCFLQRHWSRGP